MTRLRQAALACHIVLGATLASGVLTTSPTATRVVLACLLVAPLVATARGLAAGRRNVERWLSLLLVVYIGGTSVEVVAQSGTAPLLGAALLAAVLELGLVLALIRRAQRAGRV